MLFIFPRIKSNTIVTSSTNVIFGFWSLGLCFRTFSLLRYIESAKWWPYCAQHCKLLHFDDTEWHKATSKWHRVRGAVNQNKGFSQKIIALWLTGKKLGKNVATIKELQPRFTISGCIFYRFFNITAAICFYHKKNDVNRKHIPPVVTILRRLVLMKQYYQIIHHWLTSTIE